MVVKNRRRVDFYTHVVATTPEDSSSRRRIWRYGERSFPSMRTASFRGFFTSGRRSRGRRSDLLKLPIILIRVRVPINRGSFSFNCSQTIGNTTLQNNDLFDGIIESDVEDRAPESFIYGIGVSETVKAIGVEID